MPIAEDTISTDLFEFLRSRIGELDTLDVDGEPTAEEDKIKVFGFEYTDNGVPLGNMTVTILDDDRSDKSLKVYYGKDLADLADRKQRKNFFDFLLDLRRFAKSKLLGFDIRDIAKQELTKRDLAPLLGDEEETRVTESKFSKPEGTVKTSYQTLENCKLVIKHSDRVNEEVPGARSRRIHKLYVIDGNNQRFLMPFTHLGCGRAMAQHINQGGNPYDNYGVEISNLAAECKELGKFIRRTKGKVFEGDRAGELVEAATCRYNEARTLIKRLQSDRGYKTHREELLNSEALPEEATNEEFTTKSYDQQLESALPYVWRAYKMNKSIKEADALEQWANETTGDAEAPLNEIEMGPTGSGKEVGSVGDLVKDPKTGKLTVSLQKQNPNQEVNALKKALGSQVDVKLANASADEPMAGKSLTPEIPLAQRLENIRTTIEYLKDIIAKHPDALNASGKPYQTDLDRWTADHDKYSKMAEAQGLKGPTPTDLKFFAGKYRPSELGEPETEKGDIDLTGYKPSKKSVHLGWKKNAQGKYEFDEASGEEDMSQKIYPDSRDGIIEFLTNGYEVDKNFVKELDLKQCKIFPDPSVDGVWAVDSPSTGIRVIIYLKGYKDPWGEVRGENDFEEGSIPDNYLRKYGVSRMAQDESIEEGRGPRIRVVDVEDGGVHDGDSLVNVTLTDGRVTVRCDGISIWEEGQDQAELVDTFN